MFAQVIQGRTSDADGVLAALDRWLEELRPGSVGWLGSTIGVTDDGRYAEVVQHSARQTNCSTYRPA